MDISSLSSRVVALREVLGLRQTEFAEQIGIKRGTLSVIEKGTSSPSYHFIESVLNKYSEVNATWLITGRGEMFMDGYKPDPVPILSEKKKAEKKFDDGWAERLIERLERELNDAKELLKQEKNLLHQEKEEKRRLMDVLAK